MITTCIFIQIRLETIGKEEKPPPPAPHTLLKAFMLIAIRGSSFLSLRRFFFHDSRHSKALDVIETIAILEFLSFTRTEQKEINGFGGSANYQKHAAEKFFRQSRLLRSFVSNVGQDLHFSLSCNL